MMSVIIFITLTRLALAGRYWVPIKSQDCPPDNGRSLPKCNNRMSEGELCEADDNLPNGHTTYNVNNCGHYDVFQFTEGGDHGWTMLTNGGKTCASENLDPVTSVNECKDAIRYVNDLGRYAGGDGRFFAEIRLANAEASGCSTICFDETDGYDCGRFQYADSSLGASGWRKILCRRRVEPSVSPTMAPVPTVEPTFTPTNDPSPAPTSSAPTNDPSPAPTSSAPTNRPSSAPTTPAPTTAAPTNLPSSKPTESPTWPLHYASTLVNTDNMFDDLLAHFGNSKDSFLAACSDSTWGGIECDDVFSSALSDKATVNFVGPNADALAQLKNVVESQGLQIADAILYPPGYFSPTPAPTLNPTELSCATGESLVTVDVKVGYWYAGTITQLWSLAGYKCEHMSGYPESDFGRYATHTKKCCLPPATYTLTCSSGPTYGWLGGNIKINGQVFCDSDALKDTTDLVETHQVDLCNGNCVDAPETFFQLEETCENGFVPEIMMAIHPSTTSTAAEGISWRLTDACSGGNYSPVSGEHHEYFDASCCLPKGRYTLTCSASSVFTWQKSFVLINGRQYCFGSDGGETHVINMCDGVSDCPDFTTDDQGSSGGNGLSITMGEKPVITIGQKPNKGMYNDQCTFANDGECDEHTGMCDVGTDCTDCGNCGQAHDSGAVELKTAFCTAFAILAFIFF